MHRLVFLGVVEEAEENRLVPVIVVLRELIAFYDAAINSCQWFSRREKVLVFITRSRVNPMEVLLTIDFHILIFYFLSKSTKYLFQARISF